MPSTFQKTFCAPVFTVATLLACFVFLTLSGVEAAMDGDGSPDNPWRVAAYDHLRLVGSGTASGSANNYAMNHHYLQVADIQCPAGEDRSSFRPIGSRGDENIFTGVYDGRGHRIKNLYIGRSGRGHALFQALGADAVVRNLGLVEVEIATTGHSAAALAVSAAEGALVSNCFATGSVEASYFLGGLLASNRGTVEDCFTMVDVTGSSGTSRVGGLIGDNRGIVRRCYSTGAVENTATQNMVGGLIGVNFEEGRAYDSFWDRQTSGHASYPVAPSHAQYREFRSGTRMFTSSMTSIAAYTDTTLTGLEEPWDIVEGFDESKVWGILPGVNDGYPFLQVFSWEQDESP